MSTLGNDTTADLALIGIVGDAIDIQAVGGIIAVGEERYGRLRVERGKIRMTAKLATTHRHHHWTVVGIVRL
jgi:hypothetical protein